MNRVVVIFLTCAVSLQVAIAAVSVEDVIKMGKAGLGEDIIIAQIAKDKVKLDLSTDDLIKLKSAGLSDKIIKAIVAGPVAQPASIAPTASTPVAEALEIGVMYKKLGEWAEVNPEVVNWKTGGRPKERCIGGVGQRRYQR